MTRRTKALLIIGAAWLALMVATVVAFVANRRSHIELGQCLRQKPNTLPGALGSCLEYAPNVTTRVWDGGGFWAWTFALTLAAVVAAVIAYVATVRHD